MRGVLHACAALAFSASVVSFAGADTPSSPCPRGALSIYFASGDVTASAEAEKLLGKILEAATLCQPDRIDLVAHVDVAAEGPRALALSLERINLIAGELMTTGLAADRLRVTAQAADPGETPGGRLHQVDVVFRKLSDPPDADKPARAISFVIETI